MDYSIRKKIEDAANNKYEAVIVVAKLARKINDKRLATEEQLGTEGQLPNYSNKVTTEAMQQLADGEVKYVFKEESPMEDEIFPE